IDYPVMSQCNLRRKDDSDELGYFDYNFADFPERREVRAMAVLNGWMDNWDVRWENTRLELDKEEKGAKRLKPIVSDLGALFGNSTGFIRPVNGKLRAGLIPEEPNSYAWRFTAPQMPEQESVQIRNYMPISKIKPFYEMNIDDARWMARLIGQLTEDQLKQAFI